MIEYREASQSTFEAVAVLFRILAVEEKNWKTALRQLV
jgi:hypothetical protein